MALTEAQRIEIRKEVGDQPEDAVLDEMYERLADVDEVTLEILEIRHANRIASPDSFSVPGEYSESQGAETLKALEKKISGLGGGDLPVRVVPPPPARIR